MTTEPNDGTWELQDEMRCPVCNIVGGQHTLGCRTRGITHWDGCGEIETPEHAGCFISMDKQTTLRVPPERAILIDLIAELRRTTKGYLSPRAYAITVEQQREMADAAEAQLREAMRNDE